MAGGFDQALLADPWIPINRGKSLLGSTPVGGFGSEVKRESNARNAV